MLKQSLLMTATLFSTMAFAQYEPVIGDVLNVSVPIQRVIDTDKMAKDHDKIMPIAFDLTSIQFLGVTDEPYKFKTYKCKVNANWIPADGGAWVKFKNIICVKPKGKGVTKYVYTDLTAEVFLAQDADIKDDKYHLSAELEIVGNTKVVVRKNNGDKES